MKSVRSIKTEGYYVYAHRTPDKMVYFGVSQQQPYKRWIPSLYKGSGLYPYIEKFGWKNIEHMVIQDGLTKDDALWLEDWFIRKSKLDGFCVNIFNSGGKTHEKEVKQKYYKEWREKNKEKKAEYDKVYSKQYRLEHKEEIAEYGKVYRKEHREQRREYEKEYRMKNREKLNEKQRLYRLRKKEKGN